MRVLVPALLMVGLGLGLKFIGLQARGKGRG